MGLPCSLSDHPPSSSMYTHTHTRIYIYICIKYSRHNKTRHGNIQAAHFKALTVCTVRPCSVSWADQKLKKDAQSGCCPHTALYLSVRSAFFPSLDALRSLCLPCCVCVCVYPPPLSSVLYYRFGLCFYKKTNKQKNTTKKSRCSRSSGVEVTEKKSWRQVSSNTTAFCT